MKGTGTRTHLNPPKNVHVQWAKKGSYQLEQMLETISHLPNRFHMFTKKNYAIYILDNYAVHSILQAPHYLKATTQVTLIIIPLCLH